MKMVGHRALKYKINYTLMATLAENPAPSHLFLDVAVGVSIMQLPAMFNAYFITT